MNYKTLIGLEIHAELLTNTKIFCSCKNEFGADVNTNCCPVCLGLPGSLPVLNKKVLEYAIMAGLAFNCNIARHTKMDRKNYFYPDLTKAYQISQYDIPLCENGFIQIEKEDKTTKNIRIRRIHIEEDTGKSLHDTSGDTLLDYNRSGVPLIEIVTEPDMNSPEEAYKFLEKLKEVLLFTGVSDVKMEQGSLRCDVNINVVREDGLKSNIVELKNLNSFKAAVKAMEYEIKRHIDLLESGQNTVRETRRWDDSENRTISMRSKETVQDYRYFPEPDIVNINISDEFIENVKKSLPELPDQKRERFIKEYMIPEYDAKILTSSKELSSYFEDIVKLFNEPKVVSNWIMTELLRRVNDEGITLSDLKFEKEDFADLLSAISQGKINNNAGKKVFRAMFETGKKPNEIIEQMGLVQLQDENEIKQIIISVLENNKQSIEDYKNGKQRAFGFLVGQIMKASQGKANPQIVNSMLKEIIDNM
ncbi:aspartyl/glutamyl-tRNA(Asn/Gln) amidotransferase subunit B [Alkalithermobacter thermoalcaliphilus JW-YL-7 = DSM 7308]|uniref:Aspartyl/glutamyl-tRNA(Asn/Gln) amidotransferase subunit B n=1 Tax=Alkalithermobacter thermoalcaliphilus JW-YL-7 = DSM 7308 TaxID=1121328 RepID=A0A150FS20_CLOPD|nr:Aspartyl/glutamyl-tRNA(Asn/Gln) amidotransferase subunit B [[Clostridium] paradoxum JW-YL-7 = DSM 7308]SHK35412.1 aspartyl/glutamyl-tRNA(Asn/Gln) amidotransferase subunit B [[Clostridium] paradoxum JW-YL-7 = DSM 7308]